MLVGLIHVAPFKLTDLLSSAGATIGVIIAGTIFLQFLSTKYLDLAERYRSLTTEYRKSENGNSRHSLLQTQIRGYRRRLINRASWLAAVALLSFVVGVLAGGFSMAFPPVEAFKWVGTFALGIGLLLIGAAVLLELIETLLADRELGHEVGDLDDPVKQPFG
jgi:hypothetical protein